MIENPKSPRVRRVSALARKKDRREQGMFLVEGPQAVRELLVHMPEQVVTVYATTDTSSWQLEIDRLADRTQTTIERVTPQVLAAMAETVTPQGVIAVARTWTREIGTALSEARLIAVLHEVRDPGNAGTVIRAADAAGADAVVISGESIDPFHPKVVRSTTGSIFHLPIITVADLGEVIRATDQAGLTALAADVRGEDLPEARADGLLRERVAWVFGNEARGLSDDDRAVIGRAIRLPLYGKAESLNLATAASVLLYETAFEQRR